MATCRECLHYDVCKMLYVLTNTAKHCIVFKNKSDYVKRGEWKYNKYGQMYCSICELYPELAIEKPYCPNCGADMRKEDNNER